MVLDNETAWHHTPRERNLNIHPSYKQNCHRRFNNSKTELLILQRLFQRSCICQTDGGVLKQLLVLEYAHRVLTNANAMKDSSNIM
jgi:hypothetical protein